jgi:hypothetical protein
MAHEREIQVALARCVSIMTVYHNGDQSPSTKDAMVSEVRAVARSIEEFNLGCMATERQIILPVESELLALFGPRVGEILNSDFLWAFQGWTEPTVGRPIEDRSRPVWRQPPRM